MANKDLHPSYDLMAEAEAGNALVKMVYPSILGPKQGHSFCGVCCDMRRATIIVNMIVIICGIIDIISTYGMYAFLSSDGFLNSIDDDTRRKYYENLTVTLTEYFYILSTSVFSIVFSCSAIIGAITFNAWLVLANAIWLTTCIVKMVPWLLSCISTIVKVGRLHGGVTVYAFFIGMPIWKFLCLYAHVMFMYELLRSKTMSKQTYLREEQSCCCVSRRQ